MNLVCSKCGAQLNTAGNCIAGCRSPAIGTNCGWCGRGLPGDAPPLAARIAALEAVLHERLEALDEAQRIAELTTKAHDRMAQAREHDEAKLTAERQRWKAAETLLRRCLPIADSEARMAADLTRFAPLDFASQAAHDSTEWDSERLVREIPAHFARYKD